jgi:hypothetical protein
MMLRAVSRRGRLLMRILLDALTPVKGIFCTALIEDNLLKIYRNLSISTKSHKLEVVNRQSKVTS